MSTRSFNFLSTFLLFSCIYLSDIVSTQDVVESIQLQEPVNFNRPTWTVEFEERELNISMKETKIIRFTVSTVDTAWGDDLQLHVISSDESLLQVSDITYTKNDTKWTGNFTAEGIFLGHTQIFLELYGAHVQPERSFESLNVIVVRTEGTIDKIFMITVGTFVMLLYINFGAALELDALKLILLRPVGPAIGLIGQFLIMPILGYIIGYYIFSDMVELRLGLFFTGSAPAGGASNIFTVILNGNLNLSITMTAISNLAAFVMMPFWIFTLGSLIFRDGSIPIPYKNIAMMSCSLVFPLAIGIAMQKYYPKTAQKLAKYLKPIAFVLIIVIMVFACSVNSFMFKLFSWRIIIASSALPWCGYIIGWIMGIALGQSQKDSLTIAIETGIQNSGIAIFMLLLTLPQPQADMTSAVPVATSMMTPLPLIGMYIIKKLFCRTSIEETEDPGTKDAKVIEIEQIMEKGQTNPAVSIEKK